ncbi:hypothetical protein MANES_13G043500v8 [Manihot esculenta]|uniref:Uncharacterized protein n=1 Tax=Manihot esculenta TaxID=3983 RepID=A0ACB7GJ96_MANES|nr:hypothetical protein MANES_13G043500v8 [Manihot esculenta]
MDAMEEEQVVAGEEREIWLEREQDDLLGVNDSSIFYGDFPLLPDFPCMSSSSSSSSTQAPVKAMASSSSSSSVSSSSSAASWAVLKSDAEVVDKKNYDHQRYQHNHHHGQYDPVEAPTTALSSTASMEIPQPSNQAIEDVGCMDEMETFGYMDLFENNDLFDPSSIFQPDERFLDEFQQEQNTQPEQKPQQGNEELIMETKIDETQQQGNASEDLAMVFLEWLKTNKETVSAEDLRKVKIKKATIECAAKRLGGGKEAMKQLLKLILEWVQTNHLQKRRMKESSPNNISYQGQESLQNPNPSASSNPNLNCNSIPPDQTPCFTQSPWVAPPPYVSETGTVIPGYHPMVGYMGDPFGASGASSMAGHSYPPIPPSDYHMLDSPQSWSASHFVLASPYTSFADNNLQPVQGHPPVHSGYGNQYPYQYLPAQPGDRLMRLGSSATKEARKKRMARQRRFLSHHRNHNQQNVQANQHHQNQSSDHHARLGNDNVAPTTQPNPGNWVYWPASGAVSTTPVMSMDVQPVHTSDRPAMQSHQSHHQRQVASDRRQGWKPEKNLRFLLQKVLKQSDVGNLGRIVLPKKEAEIHLPELEARDGISIAMEDIGTSRIWNMRYRFWPNNKSRMYLLENTGDFVRTNGLQEGDFIVIYSDVKCGKYLIRGVKVRQPGSKSENKKSGKSQRNLHASSASAVAAVNASSSTPMNLAQTVK